MSANQLGSTFRSHKRLILVAGILLALVLICLGGYAFATSAETLHLTVITNDHSRTLLDTTTHDATSVQRLYTHTLGLQGVSPGTYSCPVGAPFTYHLTFTHRGITTLDTSVNTSGCAFLVVFFTRRATDDTFWQLLSQVASQPLPFPPDTGK